MKPLWYLVYFIFLAILLRWPTFWFWEAIPIDSTFPQYALGALDLATGGSPFRNFHLEWPIGIPTRYLAWPLLLVATPLNWLFSPVEALNLAVLIWLSAQGFGMYWLLQKMNLSAFASCLAATLALINPHTLSALGNSQFENVAPFFLLLCYWAASRNYGWLTFVALICCSFSSPYLGFLAAVLTIMTAPRNPKLLLILLLSITACYSYYSAIERLPLPESLIVSILEQQKNTSVLHLLSPIIQTAESPVYPTPWSKITRLSMAPYQSDYDAQWLWGIIQDSSYIGAAWLIVGGIGLWRFQKHPLVAKITVWGIICLLLSLGTSLHLLFFELPMPWTLSQYAGALSQMQNTARFLAGVALMLSVGIAMLPYKRSLIVFLVLCVLDSFLVSPANWPIQSRIPTRSDVLKDISEPVVFWPAPPLIESHRVIMLSLVLRQPIALFAHPEIDLSSSQLKIKNNSGQDLASWKALVQVSGAQSLVQFQNTIQETSQVITSSSPLCDDSFCVWELSE